MIFTVESIVEELGLATVRLVSRRIGGERTAKATLVIEGLKDASLYRSCDWFTAYLDPHAESEWGCPIDPATLTPIPRKTP